MSVLIRESPLSEVPLYCGDMFLSSLSEYLIFNCIPDAVVRVFPESTRSYGIALPSEISLL